MGNIHKSFVEHIGFILMMGGVTFLQRSGEYRDNDGRMETVNEPEWHIRRKTHKTILEQHE
jgi:hypothetical protein